jgi:ABC-type transport system substrate-binding protein
LLALNAAILAAQAGAQGRGFRIVADEIKELSERTSTSTREIEQTIKSVREDVEEAIDRITVGGLRASDGVELASRASELLAEIRQKTNAASERIRLIAGATEVQAAESHTVLEAVDLVRCQAREIERATGEHAVTARLIGERAAQMRSLTDHVRRATGEQAEMSRYIASAMGNLIAVVERVRSGAGKQTGETERLTRLAAGLRDIIERNQSSVSAVNGAVDLLVREAELVAGELEFFQLPAPERGGHLRSAIRSSQMVLDPAVVSPISRIEVMTNVFEGLVQFGERVEIRPAIAESWDISPDGCVYTFRIRESARFHNGRRVKADDVKYSFERQMRLNKETAARVFCFIVGAEQFLTSESDTIEGIEVLDEQTVIIRLIQPLAFFLFTLCTDHAFVVPREEIEKVNSDFAIRPLGAGPFRVVEPVLGKEVQLERFSNYWNPDLPYADRLTVAFGMNADEILEALVRGELDYTNDLPLTYLAELRRRAPEITIIDAVQPHVRMLTFDCERPPFSDRRVRQAMCYSIDRKRFLEAVYDGMAEVARGAIPPGLLGFDPAARGYYLDRDRARLLMKEAGYGSGFDTEIWWLESVNRAVECLRDDLAEIGIRVEFRYAGPAEMERAIGLRMAPITGTDWYAEYPDSDSFTHVLFNSRKSNFLTATYFNEEVNRLTTEARTVMSRERRAEIYREVSSLLLEDAPCAFLAHRRSFVAYREGLEGMALRLMSPFVSPRDMWFMRR